MEDKAKQRALEKYPLMSNDDKEGLEALKYIGMECEDVSVFNRTQEAKQAYFVEGYQQAEKDLLENEHEKSWRLDKKLWKGIKGIERASYQYMYDASNDWAYDIPTWEDVQDAFKAGSEWRENLWKPADGDDLPEIDREVIALLDNGKIVFAHRPSEYWDGKDIITGKVTRYYPKTYDKGGWNIPNVKWWLDCNMDSILKRNDENNKIDKR